MQAVQTRQAAIVRHHAAKNELSGSISLDEYVPEDHLLRAVDRYLDLRNSAVPG